MSKTKWQDLYQKPRVELQVYKTEEITDKNFVKNLRNKKKLSQRLFAEILGISEKTVEKWEQGANPVKGAASRLLYLLDKYDFLWNSFYKIEKEIVVTNSYVIKQNENKDKRNNAIKIDFKVDTQDSYEIKLENKNTGYTCLYAIEDWRNHANRN